MPVTTTTVVSTIPKYNCTIQFSYLTHICAGDLIVYNYIVTQGIWIVSHFNSVSNVAENGTNPQEHRETTEELFAEFHPFRCGLWRREGVGAVLFKVALGLSCGQSLRI